MPASLEVESRGRSEEVRSPRAGCGFQREGRERPGLTGFMC